ALRTLMGLAGKGKTKRVDKDPSTLVCNPHATCKAPPTPSTTTTTTITTTTTLSATCSANTTTTTLPATCGNGKVDPGEECDDGNRVDGDGCDSNCTVTRCGNGVKTAGEDCDPPCGSGCGAGQVCTDTCTCSS